MKNWNTVKLGEVCECGAFGPRFSGTMYASNGNVACLRTTDISLDGRIDLSTMPLADLDVSKFKTHFLMQNDLVITRSGRVGTVAIFQGFDLPVLPGAFLIRLRLLPHATPEFFKYYLNSPAGQQQIHTIATGSVQQNINLTNLYNLDIPLPPLPEQRRIAGILGCLDAKIELNRRMNANLEAQGSAIFKNWFVDFEPFKRQKFIDSPLGKIPKGWRVGTIGEVIETLGGGTPSTKESKFWTNGIYHWTTPKDFSSMQSPVLVETARKITEAGLKKISSGLLPKGTLLMSSRAPVGYLAISAIPVAINQGFIAMKSNENISSLFMLHWCRENMDTIQSWASGTVFPEISKEKFRPLPIIIPPSQIIFTFTSTVQPFYEKITNNEQESRVLSTIRDTLLPRLMRGEI